MVAQTDDVGQVRARLGHVTDNEIDCALSTAVFHGKERMVEILLQHQAYANAVIYNHETNPDRVPIPPIFSYKMWAGMRERDNGPGVPVNGYRRVLHHAYENRQLGIMKMLLQSGADILLPFSVVKMEVMDGQLRMKRYTASIVDRVLRSDDQEMLALIAAEAWRQFTLSEASRFPALHLADIMNVIETRQIVPAHLKPPVHHVVARDPVGLAQWTTHTVTQDQKDKALAYAVHLRDANMVDILLRAGAYANAPRLSHAYNYPTKMSLSWSAMVGLQDIDYWARDHGMTEKLVATAARVLHEAFEHRDMPIIRLLLEANASLKYKCRYIQGGIVRLVDLIVVAIIKNDVEMVTLFRQHGELDNINQLLGHHEIYNNIAKNPPALGLACALGHNEMIQHLLENGANPDVTWDYTVGYATAGYKTSVHTCIRLGNRKGLNHLMRRGVDINVYDESPYSPLESAIQYYLRMLVELGGIRVLDIYDMIEVDDGEEGWLDHQLNVVLFNQVTAYLENYNHQDPGDLEDTHDQDNEVKRRRGIIKDLLEYNVDFDFPQRTDEDFVEDGDEPSRKRAWLAAPRQIRELVQQYRYRQSVEYLRQRRDSRWESNTEVTDDHIDFQDKYGKTALHRAVENGQVEAVFTLLSKHPNLQLRDNSQQTALEALRERYNVLDLQTNDFKFPLEIKAKMPMYRQIARMIVRYMEDVARNRWINENVILNRTLVGGEVVDELIHFAKWNNVAPRLLP